MTTIEHRARRLAIDAIRARMVDDVEAEGEAIREAVLDSPAMLAATLDRVVDAAAQTVRAAATLLGKDPVELFDQLALRAQFDEITDGIDPDAP